jgi:predicted dehydrogenase
LFKIGVVGYRNHAKRIIDIVNNSNYALVNKIFHPSKTLDIPEFTNDIEDLIKCDAIMILSPNNTHLEYLDYLSTHKYDSYIFCEKPPVSSLKQLSSLLKLKLNPNHVYFNFNFLFCQIKEIYDKYTSNGILGKPIHMHVYLTQGLAFKEKYINSWRANTGPHKHGITETKAIHWIHLANHFFGEIESYSYFPKNYSENSNAHDTCYLSLYYKNGVSVNLFLSYAAPYDYDISLVGTNGYIKYRNNVIRVFSPRDTFDKNGLFSSPPCINEYDYNNTGNSMYIESLERSVNYFLKICRDSKIFPNNLFSDSIEVNRFLLGLYDKTDEVN